MFSPEVSEYPNATVTISSERLFLLDYLPNPANKSTIELLRSLTPEEYKEEKKKLSCKPPFGVFSKLSCITPSGIFPKRNNANLFKHSQTLCLDYDNVPPEQAKDFLRTLAYIFAIQTSPSGRGVKAFIRLSGCTLPFSHPLVYAWISNEIHQSLGFKYEACKGAKGLSQACFDSYDPDLFLNPSCCPLSLSNIFLAIKEQENEILHSYASFDKTDIPPSVVDRVKRIHENLLNHKGVMELWNEGFTRYYPSHSHADLAFAKYVAFILFDVQGTMMPKLCKESNLTHSEGIYGDVIDACLRQSKLMRDKWDVVHSADGFTYGAMTLAKAINHTKILGGMDKNYYQNIPRPLFPLRESILKLLSNVNSPLTLRQIRLSIKRNSKSTEKSLSKLVTAKKVKKVHKRKSKLITYEIINS